MRIVSSQQYEHWILHHQSSRHGDKVGRLVAISFVRLSGGYFFRTPAAAVRIAQNWGEGLLDFFPSLGEESWRKIIQHLAGPQISNTKEEEFDRMIPELIWLFAQDFHRK